MTELSQEDIRQVWIQCILDGDLDLIPKLVESHPFLLHELDAPQLPGHTTALAHASRFGSLALVRLLIRLGANLETPIHGDEIPWKPLHGPALHSTPDWQEKARLLSHEGAWMDIWSACGLGQTELVREFLEETPEAVNLPGPDGLRPLHFTRDASTLKVLLEHGARWTARDFQTGRTPVQWAATEEARLRLFLNHGAPSDIFVAALLGDGKLGETCLQECPTALEQSAVPEGSPRDRGWGAVLHPAMRPCILAQESGRPDWVRQMLPKASPLENWIFWAWQGGASPDCTMPPLPADARLPELPLLAAAHRRLDTLQRLQEAGWPMDHKDDRGWTLLHACAAGPWPEGIRWSLEQKASVQVRDTQGRTALDQVIQGWMNPENHTSARLCAELLLQAGAPIDAPSQLMDCCYEELREAYELLVQYGADPEAMDESGLTPADLARELGWT